MQIHAEIGGDGEGSAGEGSVGEEEREEGKGGEEGVRAMPSKCGAVVRALWHCTSEGGVCGGCEFVVRECMRRSWECTRRSGECVE